MPRLPGESQDDAYGRWEKVSDVFRACLETAGVERESTPVRDWPGRGELRNETKQSWERTFDRAGYGPHEFRQTTVHALPAADVVEAA